MPSDLLDQGEPPFLEPEVQGASLGSHPARGLVHRMKAGLDPWTSSGARVREPVRHGRSDGGTVDEVEQSGSSGGLSRGSTGRAG